MVEDEIIQEVRALREAYAERFDFDVHALFQDAKQSQALTDRQVIWLEPRQAVGARARKPNVG